MMHEVSGRRGDGGEKRGRRVGGGGSSRGRGGGELSPGRGVVDGGRGGWH